MFILYLLRVRMRVCDPDFRVQWCLSIKCETRCNEFCDRVGLLLKNKTQIVSHGSNSLTTLLLTTRIKVFIFTKAIVHTTLRVRM